MPKSLVLFSGGLDSTVLLARQYDLGDEVTALSIYYGQKHAKEQEFAKWQCEHYNIPLIEADLSSVFNYNRDCCSLLEGSNLELDSRSYAEQLAEGSNSAYVPFRNGLFLSYAAAVALQLNYDTVVYGAHKDDLAGAAYPDCSPEFIQAMQLSISHGTGGAIKLQAPFLDWNKSKIVSLGMLLEVDLEHTWSCYAGGETPCGKCGTCIDRQKAMEEAGYGKK